MSTENTPTVTEEHLRILIANGQESIAATLIAAQKLPYRIDGGQLRDALEQTDIWLQKFITADPDTIRLKDDVRKLAKCQDEVLITGDTGTGKELIARAMIGTRAGKFIAVNCAGLPEMLIESLLFGHVKGSFTGADNTRAGFMAAAKDGILFLDEVGELPILIQAKLLRALQDKKIIRVGSTVEEEISCKFVCATHRNIRDMVKQNLFRQDLYARISTFELHIKPLKERKCDVVPILESLPGGREFLSELKRRNVDATVLALDDNVRSLQKYVKRYAILGRISS